MTSYTSAALLAAQSTWSRILSLGSVPGTPEEARAFLQRRIGLFFASLSVVGCAIYAAALVITAVHGAELMPAFSGPMRLTHLAFDIATAAVFVATRRKPRSLRALNLMDGAGTALVVVTIMAMMAFNGRMRYAAELEFLIALMVVLTSRAAIVPSQPTRTFALGIGTAAIFVANTAWLNTGLVRPNAPPAMLITVMTGVWALVMVGLTTLVSHEIYGLQRRIEDAMQLGQYTLEEKIGEGGMGVVYRARHALLRRPTAVKLLLPERSGEQSVARFEREVQVTSQLTHPNTVAIYDYGRTPDRVFYYAMEYLEGLDLETLVDITGPQRPGRVMHVLRQVAGALAEAHRACLVHRDIKPANVILTDRGGLYDFVKVVDFGLVRELDHGAPALSGTHEMMGTPLYMAPEAICDPRSVDARSDIYAVGAVAYWMLTATLPFEGGSLLQVLAKALHEPIILPSLRAPGDVPLELEDLVMACLEKDPELRPRNGTVLLERLAAIEGVPPWEEADARAWWGANAEAVTRRRRTLERAVTGTNTVCVARREAATIAAPRVEVPAS